MKNTLILLFACLLMGVAAFVVVNKDDKPLSSNSSSSVEDRNFAVKNVDEIGKIFIADRNGMNNTITRKGGDWIINGKYKIRKGAITSLLASITTVTMSFIPAKASIPTIVENLSTHGVKVEIYNKQEEKIRAYYVGGMTNDEEGTYMIMEGAEQPYVMKMPSVTGGLRVRYLMEEIDWRDRYIFDWKMEEIDFVSVEYPKQKNKSFVMEKSGKDYNITPFNEITPKSTKPYKKGSAESYLIGYEKFVAENIINDYRHRDSISSLTPFAIVTVKNNKGESKTARFHPIRPLDANGLPLSDDKVALSTAVERYHVNVSTGDFYLVQQRIFGRAFWDYKFFFKE